jgi:hypothetical protein
VPAGAATTGGQPPQAHQDEAASTIGLQRPELDLVSIGRVAAGGLIALGLAALLLLLWRPPYRIVLDGRVVSRHATRGLAHRAFDRWVKQIRSHPDLGHFEVLEHEGGKQAHYKVAAEAHRLEVRRDWLRVAEGVAQS